MPNIRVLHITLDILAGATITEAVREAINYAQEHVEPGGTVTFDFNGTAITVDAKSDESVILQGWHELGCERAKVNGAKITPLGIKWGSWR